jgi:non-ribosomal peptide synthetase component E (peptide arylation enzyme)
MASGDLGLDDVRHHLAAADFPKFKWPEFVHVVPDLPQNRVGKLNRGEATTLAEQLTGSVVP